MPNTSHEGPVGILVIGAADVDCSLSNRLQDIVDAVASAYVKHEQGRNVNPNSCFLRFPERPEARIIALPAYLGDEDPIASVTGIKWIASFPGNITHNLQRASAVLVLNNCETGFPYAVLESSGISAHRTAASAALAASVLGGPPESVGFVGGGVIARTIADHLSASGRLASDVRCCDLDPTSASRLACHVGTQAEVTSLEKALSSDLVVLATTAAVPYVADTFRLRPGQLVLNISLRDLSPASLLNCNNVLDDIDHCLKADTTPHLLEQQLGHRDFVTGTLGGVLLNRVALNPDRPTVFSPFGLGVLDLAVGSLVHRECVRTGRGTFVPDFFGETTRW